YIAYLIIIFELFTNKNIILSPKKLFLGYFSIEFLNFYVDLLGFLITKERIEVIRNFEFPIQLKALE
ncbi:hypothetical protein B0T20DRAFT_361668, partial [Sordaria brevicollis]